MFASFKHITTILVAIIFASVISSCCFMVICDECDPNEMDITLDYKDYSHEELDTVIIKQFEKSTGFSVMVDSFAMHTHFDTWQQNTNFYSLVKVFTLFNDFGNKDYRANYAKYDKYNYQLYFPKANLNLNITEMVVNFEKAEGCCDCDRYVITSYLINNSFRYTNDIPRSYYKITK